MRMRMQYRKHAFAYVYASRHAYIRTRSIRTLVSEVRLLAHSRLLEPAYENVSISKNHPNNLCTNGRADSLTFNADQKVLLRITILPRPEFDPK